MDDTYIYSHTCRHMYAHLHILNSLYIYFFTYLHSHKHILMHTHVYILIHTHTHTHTQLDTQNSKVNALEKVSFL